MINAPRGAARYEQLAALLRERIESGDLAPGDRLPSEKDLMQTYDLSRPTVRAAIAQLRRDGLVDVVHGRGVFAREQEPRRVQSVPRGSTVEARMPSPDEVAEFGMAEGVPLLVVTIGGRTSVYPADQVTLRAL